MKIPECPEAEGSAMLNDPKTITVFLDVSPSGRSRASHAVAFAKRWSSHLVGVHVLAGVSYLHRCLTPAATSRFGM
jgi:hypothetical protein